MHPLLYPLILGLNAVAALLMVALVWRRRATPGSVPFVLLLLAAGLWSLLNALEKAVLGKSAQVLFARLEYPGIVSTGPLWLLFALAYARQTHLLTRRNVFLLFVIPIITVILVMTNDWHRLIWTEIVPASDALDARMLYSHGPWFWVTAAYNYMCVLAGTVVLLWAVVRVPWIYRRQAWAIVSGISIPWIANLAYLLGRNPFPGLDPTPIAFTLTGVIYAWTIFRFQLFDLMPVARDALIERLTDAVLVLDAQNRIVDLNPQSRTLLGLDDSIVGQHIEVALSGWEVLIALCSRSKEDTHAEFVHGGAARRHFELQTISLYDRAHRFNGRLLVLRDINERKELEQARDSLMHTIIHDLRSPLTSLNTALRMIALEQMDPELQQRMVGIAQNSVNRMSMLVNSILDVNRMESGQMPLERGATCLAELVAEVIHLQMPLADLCQLRLTDQVPDDLSTVWVDDGLISRVLQNLVDNAIKFTPAGGEICVTACHRPESGQVHVSVIDSGPGIPPEMQERLFNKFVTSDIPGRGTGLGLVFCRLAVEAHGGRIWVESEPGKGTTFTFSLPTTNNLV